MDTKAILKILIMDLPPWLKKGYGINFYHLLPLDIRIRAKCSVMYHLCMSRKNSSPQVTAGFFA